jgi:hypothetical protein
MAWRGVEIEIEVPCAGGQKHPVRLRFTGWGEYEVVHNPCEELLGPVFARMAACTHYLHKKFPKAFRNDTDLKRRLVEAFGAAGAPAVPALIQALRDRSENVRRAAAEALGKLGDPQAVPAFIKALRDRSENVRFAAAEAHWAISATHEPCPRSSKHCGIGVRMFALRQRRRWANSATPKPCPRSSKHCGIGVRMFALRQRRRWANSATPKPCPRSSKHCGIGVRMFALRQRRRWANSATPKPCPRS